MSGKEKINILLGSGDCAFAQTSLFGGRDRNFAFGLMLLENVGAKGGK